MTVSLLMAATCMVLAAPSSNAKKNSRDKKRPKLPKYESVVTAGAVQESDGTLDETYVEGDRLRRSSSPSMLESLAGQTADMYVTSRGMGIHGVANGASGSIHIRGFGGSPNSQVLVVEDGVPDYQGIFGHPIPDAYVPFLVRDVSVLKGGDSVMYGTNAMGGVILIRSRWLGRNGFELFNDASYGSFDSIREAAGLLGHWRRWDLAMSVSYLGTEGHRVGAGGKNLVAQVASRYHFGPSMAVTVRERVLHLKGGDPGPATHPYLNHWYDVWRDNASLHFVLRRPGLKVHVTPYLNVGLHRLYDGFHSVDYVLGYDARALVAMPHGLDAIVGTAGEWVDGQVENRIDGTRPAIPGVATFSLYSQLSWRPIRSLRFVGGVRESISSRYGLIFLFKGGVTWRALSWLRFRTHVARNFRQPTIRELYLPFPTANPGLKPEFALNWDAGATLVFPHVLVAVTGYRNDIDNMIKYFGSWPTAEVINIDHIIIWGLEGKVVLDGIGPLRCFLTGNWQDVGRYTKQNPSGKMNLSIQGSHRFGAQRVSWTLSGEWVHGIYMSNYHRDPISDVLFVDFRVSDRYSPPAARYSIEPYVIVRNLLNRRNAFIKDYPLPGITVFGGLSLRFHSGGGTSP